jgi:ribA/ribD-fused uncharacterized protein
MIKKFDGEYRWLSNFWPAEVMLDGEVYPTVEHAYQAAKTLDLEKRRKIRDLERPGLAKREGKKVKVRLDWEDIKISVMYSLLQQKFLNPELKSNLLATGDIELQEGNTWGDTFWGVCKGVGNNHLGILLMKVRKELNENFNC